MMSTLSIPMIIQSCTTFSECTKFAWNLYFWPKKLVLEKICLRGAHESKHRAIWRSIKNQIFHQGMFFSVDFLELKESWKRSLIAKIEDISALFKKHKDELPCSEWAPHFYLVSRKPKNFLWAESFTNNVFFLQKTVCVFCKTYVFWSNISGPNYTSNSSLTTKTDYRITFRFSLLHPLAVLFSKEWPQIIFFQLQFLHRLKIFTLEAFFL